MAAYPTIAATRDDVPAELVVEAGVVTVTVAVALGGLLLPAGSPLRAAATLPLLVFLPGYALTTVLFPASRSGDHTFAGSQGGLGGESGVGSPANPGTDLRSVLLSVTTGTSRDHGTVRPGVTCTERLALSFGFSVAMVPLLMVGMWAVAETVALVPLLGGLISLIGVLFGLGLVRRSALAPEHRYQLRYRRGRRAVAETVDDRWTGRAVQIALFVSVLVLVASFGGAALAPRDGTQYTSVALLTETDGGELVAADYPNDLTAGGSQQVVLEVENAEGTPTDYTVVAALQRVEDGTVVESNRLRTFSQRVAAGETWLVPHEPSRLIGSEGGLSGSDVQLTYLLYTDTPPAEPDRDNAYRSLYIGVELGPELEDGETR